MKREGFVEHLSEVAVAVRRYLGEVDVHGCNSLPEEDLRIEGAPPWDGSGRPVNMGIMAVKPKVTKGQPKFQRPQDMELDDLAGEKHENRVDL